MARKKKASLTIDVVSDPLDSKIADGTVEMRADANGLYSKDAAGTVKRMVEQENIDKISELPPASQIPTQESITEMLRGTDYLATQTANGLISAADKKKLDELGAGGTSSGTIAVKMDDIATIGTTSKTLAVETSRQYWQTIATATGSVTLKLTIDGTQLADGNAAEIVFRWPDSGAYVGTIEIIVGTVTVWSFTLNQGTPAAVVKIVKIGGEIVTSYIK